MHTLKTPLTSSGGSPRPVWTLSRALRLATAMAVAALCAPPAVAQAWPSKPIA